MLKFSFKIKGEEKSVTLSALIFIPIAGYFFYHIITHGEVTAVGVFLNLFTLGVHELGHPVFGKIFLDNHFMMIIGGTAMEIIVPLSAFFYFFFKDSKIQADFCLLLLGIAFKSIGFYAGYTLEKEVVLVNATAETIPDWDFMHKWFHTAGFEYEVRTAFYILSALTFATGLYLIFLHIKKILTKPYQCNDSF